MSADIELPNEVVATFFRDTWMCPDENVREVVRYLSRDFVAPITNNVQEVEAAMARYVISQIAGAKFLCVSNDDFGEFDDPGPVPGLTMEDTPENRAELEKMRKEAEDPTTPAGRFYKLLSEASDADD